jgi:hypothetical protein
MFEATIKDYTVSLRSDLGTKEYTISALSEAEATFKAQLQYRTEHSGFGDLYVVNVLEKIW